MEWRHLAKSEAYKIAKLQCETQLTSQVLAIATDPLWSTIAGFAAVHKLRKEDYVGPVADDILYAGIIAINTARQPALMDLAGKLSESLLPAAVAGAGGAWATSKLLNTALAAAGGTTLATVAAKNAKVLRLAPVVTVAKVALPVAAAAAISVTAYDQIVKAGIPARYKTAWTKIPFWKRALGATLVGSPIPLKEYAKNVAKIDRGEKL